MVEESTRHDILSWIEQGQSILRRLPYRYKVQLPWRRIERFLRRTHRRVQRMS